MIFGGADDVLILWVYLRNGLNWRKEAVAESAPTARFVRTTSWPDGTKEDRLDGKVVVLHVFGENPDLTPINKKIVDTGEELFKQFGQNLDFRLAMISEGGTAEFRSHIQTRPSIDYATWVWTGGLGSWRTIVETKDESFVVKTGAKPMSEYYALADTAGGHPPLLRRDRRRAGEAHGAAGGYTTSSVIGEMSYPEF